MVQSDWPILALGRFQADRSPWVQAQAEQNGTEHSRGEGVRGLSILGGVVLCKALTRECTFALNPDLKALNSPKKSLELHLIETVKNVRESESN